MYRYDEFDHAFVSARVEQFRDQVARRLSGELAQKAAAFEDEIYVDSKPGNYAFAGDRPRLTGAEVEALYASDEG